LDNFVLLVGFVLGKIGAAGRAVKFFFPQPSATERTKRRSQSGT
jgi:hypothetical protein